jgi:hypothetical protein
MFMVVWGVTVQVGELGVGQKSAALKTNQFFE